MMGVARTMDFLMRSASSPPTKRLTSGSSTRWSKSRVQRRTLALARELAEGPQVSMRLLKRSIYKAAELTSINRSTDRGKDSHFRTITPTRARAWPRSARNVRRASTPG